MENLIDHPDNDRAPETYEVTEQLQSKPVILLAFANDKPNSVHHLRNLNNELSGLKRVLNTAEDEGICEIVPCENATIEKILDIFQDKRYNDRIAIFHFGGHANGYKLLLESAEGELTPAYREGLVSFLAHQKGLKIVFLNGCSSAQHALDLKQAGVPATIGTSQFISDEIATNLSIRFYNGMGNGFPLNRAWKEAIDYINIKEGPDEKSGSRDFDFQTKGDRIPWDIYFKEGGEDIKEWNLPEAANDPLFGLPEIPESFILPASPFLYLKKYEKKDAAIFFGRASEIRALYNKIIDPNSHPIILLHGQSGVGKSSLIEAGLIPRIEDTHVVIYARRIQQYGLLKTLEDVLNNYPQNENDRMTIFPLPLIEKWKFIENIFKKSIVFIMDQIEEIFTHPLKEETNELDGFLQFLQSIFQKDLKNSLSGKIILAYRKEYHPEIQKKFKNIGFPFEELFIERLNQERIIEVVTGLTRRTQLKKYYYNIEVKHDLPSIIANDLLEDKNSPISPILQILLTKMWQKSIKDSPSHIEFNSTIYEEIKKQGIAMDDFLRQQMTELKEWNCDVVDSGLALDVLKYFTTELGTARVRNSDEIKEIYNNHPDVIENLIRKLKDLYLLTHVNDKNNITEISLAHDTLAPVIIREYMKSDKPGHRAARILSTKINEFNREQDKNYLDPIDLEIVEKGIHGMRALNKKEMELLEISRDKKIKSEKERKRNTRIRYGLVLIILIAAAIAFIQWQSALNKARIAQANYLSSQAQLKISIDPAEAIRLASGAYRLDPNQNISRVLSEAASQTLHHPLNKLNLQHDYYVNKAIFSPAGDKILTASGDKSAKLWDLQGRVLHVFNHENEVTSALFSPDGGSILTVSMDKNVKLWNLQGTLLKEFWHKKNVSTALFSPDGQSILTVSYDNNVRIWNLSGDIIKTFNYQTTVKFARFSPDGSHILTVSKDRNAWLSELNGNQLKGSYGVDSADFSPDGNHLAFILINNSLLLWDLKNNKGKTLKNPSKIIQLAAFSPNSNLILVAYQGGIVELFDMNAILITSFTTHKEGVTSAQFSPDGKKILTTSRDNTAKLWDLGGRLIVDLYLHKNSVISATFSPDGSSILTASMDNSAKLWDLKNQLTTELITCNDLLNYAAFSPTGKNIITISTSNKVFLWDERGNHSITLDKHTKTVHSAIFSPDGKNILTASSDKTAKLWDLRGNLITDLRGHKDNVNTAVFSPDGEKILTASYDNTAKLWNLHGNLLQSYQHQKGVISAQFSPDGEKVLTASFDETAILWSLKGDILQNFNKQYGQVRTAIISPDGSKILTISAEIILWDLNGHELAELNFLKSTKGKMRLEDNRFAFSGSFSPDSKKILTIHYDNSVRLWNLKGELLTQMAHNKMINSAYFSPDGTMIVTASFDNTIKLWNLDGNLLSDYNKHKNVVNSAVFSSDGNKILSASDDKTIKTWLTPRSIILWLEKNSTLPLNQGEYTLQR